MIFLSTRPSARCASRSTEPPVARPTSPSVRPWPRPANAPDWPERSVFCFLFLVKNDTESLFLDKFLFPFSSPGWRQRGQVSGPGQDPNVPRLAQRGQVSGHCGQVQDQPGQVSRPGRQGGRFGRRLPHDVQRCQVRRPDPTRSLQASHGERNRPPRWIL